MPGALLLKLYNRFRGPALMILRLMISATLFYLAIRKIDLAAIVVSAKNIELGWIAASALVLMAQFWVTAERWRQIVATAGIPLSSGMAFRLTFISNFFNQLLPGTLGGDAFRAVILGRIHHNWRVTTHSVVVDRAVGGIALSVIVLVLFPETAQYLANMHEKIFLLAVSLFCLAIFLAILAIGSMTIPFLQDKKVFEQLRPITSVFLEIFRHRFGGLRLLCLSLGIHTFSVVSIWCLARSLQLHAGMADFFFLIPSVLLVSTIPVSIAGWGLRENAMVSLLAAIGISGSSALTISVSFGLILTVFGCAGGLLWLADPRRIAPGPQEHTPPCLQQ